MPKTEYTLNKQHLVVIGVAMSAVIAIYAYQTTRPECASDLIYANKKIDIEAATNFLNIKSSKASKIDTKKSELLTAYFDASNDLCRLQLAGHISPDELLDRKKSLFAQFSSFLALGSISDPGTSNSLSYIDDLSSLSPSGLASRDLRYRVVSDGKSIESGQELRTHDSFHVEIAANSPTYVYILLQNSSGSLIRLFPASLTGSNNLVLGTVRVPRDTEFKLDENTGQEILWIFGQSTRIDRFTNIPEVRGNPLSLKFEFDPAGIANWRGVFVEEKHEFGHIMVSSEIGLPYSKFLIDHID